MGVNREHEQLQKVPFWKDAAFVAWADFHQQLINKGREHELVNTEVPYVSVAKSSGKKLS